MKKTKAILIIGMHRSGTSAITRSISFLGPYLGHDDNFVTPLEDNPTGYWERNDILEFNESIFSHYKKTWDSAIPFPEGWCCSEEIEPFKNRLITLLKKQFLDNELWAVKDPRIAILLPLWKKVLDELNVDLSIVIAIRNPIDVSASLKKRNGFPDNKTFGIWFNYNIHAIRMSRGLPHSLVHYDDLIENWEPTTKSLASNVGLTWPGSTENLKEKMNIFIRPELRHSSTDTGNLLEMGAPEPVIELYEILMNISNSPEIEEKYYDKIDALYDNFSSYANFYEYESSAFREYEKKLSTASKMITDIQTSIWWKIAYPLRKIEQLFLTGSNKS